jgi:hypothetical protein
MAAMVRTADVVIFRASRFTEGDLIGSHFDFNVRA